MQTKVSSSELKIGMFVSSLDRPWIDTPFMLQGFLIEVEDDVKLLQQYCEFVFIDWSMSPLQQPGAGLIHQNLMAPETTVNRQSPSSPSQTPVGAAKPTPINNSDIPGRSAVFDINASVSPAKIQTRISSSNPAAESKFLSSPLANDDSDQENFIFGFAGKMMGLFKSKSKVPKTNIKSKQARAALEDRPAATERPAFIPNDIHLSMYVDASPVEEEVAPAVKAHTRVNEMLISLTQDIKANKHFAIEKTEAVVQEVVDSMVRNPDAMMWITRLRKQDELIYGHGLQVAVYLVALGRHLGLPKDFLERLCTVGLLLDIGKIKLSKELLKKNGRLTPEEFETVKSHVNLALDILKETSNIHPDVLLGIAQHHERENGSGYPAGLSKNEISLFGRMSGIVDSFTALTNPRSYAETIPAYEALQSLSNFNPELYQATMLEQFIQAIGVFPVGSMVELSSGEVAVVIGHSKVRRLKPRVLIISDSNKRPAPQPTTLDLLYQPQGAGEHPLIIQRGLPTGAFGLDAREYYLS
jgi:HD-GYP domain-containing protein (c-di-GMP phosphodiesterase class II)